MLKRLKSTANELTGFLKDSDYLYPLIIVLATTLLMVLCIPISAHLPDSRFVQVGWFQTWNVWDAPHYLSIAQYGYQVTGGDVTNWIAFYPFFPFVIWVFHWVTAQNVLASGYLVAFLASIVDAFAFSSLVRLDYDKATARKAVLFLFIFPTSLFLHLPYTESIFLALTLVALLCVRKGMFTVAFILAACATATRAQGLALIPAILIELYMYHRKALIKDQWLILKAILIPSIGFAIYLSINYLLFGSFFHFVEVERVRWFSVAAPPWTGFISAWKSVSWRQGADIWLIGWAQMIAAIFGLIVVIYSFLRLRLSYAVYALGVLAISTMTSFWISLPRYILIMFPIYIMLASLSRRKFVYYITVSVSLVLLITYMLLELTNHHVV